jgi:hypothetical protein
LCRAEVSRYLGDEFSPDTRVRTMKYAQGISTVVYLAFIGLLTLLFGAFVAGSDGLTATVEISGEVASVLPVIVLIAAFGAQLSASVADADGGAGFLDESLQGRVSRRTAVALLLGGSIVLTWVTDVGHVIAIASRAFAAYYLFQTLLSIVAALRSPNRRGQLPRILARGALGLLLLAVRLFALPVE